MARSARSGSASSTLATRMRPSVSVPVLSVQIVVTEPSVSTARSRLTSPLRLKILRMPRTRIMVTAISSPSGTAATARMIAVRSVSRKVPPVARPAIKITTVNPATIRVSVEENALSRTWSGVSSSSCSCRLLAILPSSVSMPIFSTCITPRPVSTVLPI